MSRLRAHLLLLALLTACHPKGEDQGITTKQSALAQGAITFHLAFETPTPRASLSGGVDLPVQSGESIQQTEGLFGQAAKSETPWLSWQKSGNISLSQPGSLAFW